LESMSEVLPIYDNNTFRKATQLAKEGWALIGQRVNVNHPTKGYFILALKPASQSDRRAITIDGLPVEQTEKLDSYTFNSSEDVKSFLESVQKVVESDQRKNPK